MFTYAASLHGAPRPWGRDARHAPCSPARSEDIMPERATTQRAKQKLRRGDSASTAAGEFVREEMHHIREGKHGARSTKQAIAIGLSKARRAGVHLDPPERGSAATKEQANRENRAGARGRKPSPTRARAAEKAL